MDPLWLQFLLAALGVVLAGSMIGRVSAEIGDRLKLGRAWAGAVLIAVATSMPELAAILTVALHGHIAMAVGGILGSILLNLMILVFVDLFDSEPIYRRVSVNHIATGLLGCGLLGLLIAGLAAGQAGWGGDDGVRIGHVGFFSLAIFAVYSAGQYVLYRISRKTYGTGEVQLETGLAKWSVAQMAFSYLGLTAVILFSAYHLGVSAEQLTERYSWGATFAGATLLGIITSLPEITNGLVCAKKKEYDLVVGDVLGSNAFVFVVLVLVDLVTLKGPLFQLISRLDAFSSMAMAGIAIVMQAVVLVALATRSVHRIWRMSVVSILLIFFYVASLVIAYRFASPY